MLFFLPRKEEWITPEIKGERPPPCAGFTLTQITHNSALLYGGVDSTSGQCLSDVYIVELSKASIVSNESQCVLVVSSSSVPLFM